MRPLSKTAHEIQPSAMMVIDGIVRQLRAAGEKVYAFGGGEPDFVTAEKICSEGIRAISVGKIKYTDASGLAELRQAISDRILSDYSVFYDKDQIAVTSGGKPAIFASLCALLDPGDEAILPAPYWASYYDQIRMAGGTPRVVKTEERNSFKITASQLDEAITPKTKVFILNNPGNPSGSLYTESELRALTEVCKIHDLYILADEMYSKLLFDRKHFVSIVSLDEDTKKRTILINGASKAYAMTGWRIGYAAAEPSIITAITSWLSHACGCPSAVGQYAAIEAFSGDQTHVTAMRDSYEVRRNYLVDRIQKNPYLSCIKPEAAFYLFVKVNALYGKKLGNSVITSEADFCSALLHERHVALTPGSAFGMPGYVRWCYAASMEDLKDGMDELESFIN